MGQSSWSLLALRPASEAEIRRWFDHDPGLNYGIITGVPCNALKGNSLCIMDVDRPKRLPKHDAPVPATVTVRTKRGSHYYFQSGDEVLSKKFPWGELKAAGGYVVGPGSIHESGHVYSFYEMLSPTEADILEIPSWLISGALQANVEASRANPLNSTLPKTEANQFLHRKNSFTMQQGRFKELWELNKDPETAIGIMGLCGRDVRGMKKAFLCPIPGHSDRNPSAALYQEPGKAIILHDFHSADEERLFWPIVDVYASCKVGRALRLRQGERAIWWLRALHDLGVVNPPIIPKYELPYNAPASVKKVYAGFCYLLELRQLYEESRVTPFNRQFAARWCMADEKTVRNAVGWLLRKGHLFISERGRPHGHKEGSALTLFSLGRPSHD